MENLEALAPVVQLNSRIVRILGQNPGKFTLQGTNTYLIGEKAPFTLIDTGEGRPSYIPILESALEHGKTTGPGAGGPPQQHVSDIIISHWHHDHVAGLPSVLGLLKGLARNASLPFRPPRIHKFPVAALSDEHFQRTIKSVERDMYTPSPDGSLFHDLHDGQSFPVTLSEPSSGSDVSFQVIHAPGHTKDSIALAFPSEGALYTADTVLGQGTAVFESLGPYLATLKSLLSRLEEHTVLYPGHGPVVNNGKQIIQGYINHRMERERQIVQILQENPEGVSTWDIVSRIYAAYPQNLWEPAAQSVNHHLDKSVSEKRAEKLSGEGKDARWKLVKS